MKYSFYYNFFYTYIDLYENIQGRPMSELVQLRTYIIFYNSAVYFFKKCDNRDGVPTNPFLLPNYSHE